MTEKRLSYLAALFDPARDVNPDVGPNAIIRELLAEVRELRRELERTTWQRDGHRKVIDTAVEYGLLPHGVHLIAGEPPNEADMTMVKEYLELKRLAAAKCLPQQTPEIAGEKES